MRASSANVWIRVRRCRSSFVAALTAAAAQVSVPLPFTPVPFTLAADDRAARRRGARVASGPASQILYLTLGLAGLPVFAFSPELPQGCRGCSGPPAAT